MILKGLWTPQPFEVDGITYTHDSSHIYQTSIIDPEKDKCPFFSIKDDDGPCAAFVWKYSDMDDPEVRCI